MITEEVEKMLELGMIKKSVSPYASPVVLVGKKDAKVCLDFRELNKSDPV